MKRVARSRACGRIPLRRRGSGESGAAFLEMTLVVLLVLVVLIATIETCIIGYMALTVQFVASRAARYAMVSTTPEGLTRTAEVKSYAQAQAQSLGLALNPATQVFICPVFRDPQCVSNDAGKPGDFVLVRIQVPAGWLLGRFHLNLWGEALAKNEFF